MNLVTKSNLTALEDLSQVEHLNTVNKGAYLDLNAGGFFGQTDDFLMLFQPVFWRFGGGKDQYWQVDDVLVPMTTFFVIPNDPNGRLYNHEMVGNRVDPKDWIDEPYEILQEGDTVVWRNKYMEAISKPPYWQVRGEQNGIKYDYTVGGLGDAAYSVGPWENLPKTLRAGYDQRCWAEGSVTYQGKTYKLDRTQAFGCHEHLCFGNTYDPVKTMEKPYYWIMAVSGPTQVYLWSLVDEVGIGEITIDYKTYVFKDMVINCVESWVDPKTNMEVPSLLKATMHSEEASAELTLTLRGRAIYITAQEPGWTIRYSMLGKIQGTVTFADGSSTPIDILTFVEWGKASFPLPSGKY